MSTELKQTDRDIEPHLMGPDMEQECLRTAEYNDKTVMCLSKLSQRITELRTAATVSSAASTEPPPPRGATHGIKLPRIDVPKFDGRPRNWNPFCEQFESTVHNNPTLTNSDKFAYLRSLLIGLASDAISGLTVMSRCYKDARDILIDRFAKSDLIVQDHIENLIDLQPVRSSDDVLGLRRLYMFVLQAHILQVHIRGLKALHVAEDSFSTVLRPLIFRRLLKDLILGFNRRSAYQDNAATSGDATASNPVSLIPLLNFLRVEVESRVPRWLLAC